MAEQQIQALTKTLNENNQILMQNCQNLDLNSRVVSDSAKAIAHTLESFDPSLDRRTDSGRIPFNIKNFDGNPRDFDSWVNQVEKHAFLYECNDKRKQLVAYQTCTGLVSDYIKRYLESEGTKTWANLKENLQSRFSPFIDKLKAFEQLVNIRQKKDEDVQFFAERLLSLSERAYPERNAAIDEIVESQLLTIFLCGLADTSIRAQVERTMPKTFEEAYRIALREQGIVYRCAIRNKDKPDRLELTQNRDEQPMEVDHSKGKNYKYCNICNKRGHRTNEHVDGYKRKPKEIECWGCKQKGHRQSNCPAKN